jgi:hypothetical protein
MHFGVQNVLCSETNQVREKIQEKNLKKKIQYKIIKIVETMGNPTYKNTHTTFYFTQPFFY